jgi:hypothetical protein
MTVLLLANWQSGWPRPGGRRAARTVPRARSGGPGRDRRPRSALCSRPLVKPEAACWRLRARLDLTRRAESSVDTAGPGRKASRTGRSARKTAFVARCGRSAPPAAARDPGRPRPAAGAGARDGGPGDAGTDRLRAAAARPQARRGRRRPDPSRRAGPASARPAPPGIGHAAKGARETGPEVPPGREVSLMTSSSQPPDLDRYLARHGFRPHASHTTFSSAEPVFARSCVSDGFRITDIDAADLDAVSCLVLHGPGSIAGRDADRY